MVKQAVKFTDVVELAKFIAQLVREGVTFETTTCRENGTEYTVELTGGF